MGLMFTNLANELGHHPVGNMGKTMINHAPVTMRCFLTCINPSIQVMAGGNMSISGTGGHCDDPRGWDLEPSRALSWFITPSDYS